MAKKKSPKKSPFKNILFFFWMIVLLPFVSFLFFVWAAASGNIGQPLPDFAELENPKSNLASEVISSDQTVLGKYYFQNRTNVHYYELSPNLINALIATEDIRFEEHSGVDLRGLFRVLFKTVLARQESSGGGSTITQQLAKNLFHSPPHSTWERVVQKVQEWVISVRLERNYTKQEIMAMYFNTVEFGSNAFGIKSAARTFFNKTPAELNVSEAAVIVGLLKAPTMYSPVRNPKTSLARRNVVLSQMTKYNFLSKHEFDSLKSMPTVLRFQNDDHNFGVATYFREVLRGEMIDWCKQHINNATGKPYNLYTDGLKIYTTINSKMQRYAEEATKEHLTEEQKLFNAHWKGKEPWAAYKEIIPEGMHRSERFVNLKKQGMGEKEITKNFNTKTEMTIFSWQGDRDTVLTPLDSVKYYKKILQSGFMSMEPQTGFVRAWVGGLDYRYFKYDHVKDGKRQVGSTIKSFLYTLAMQEGYSPCYKIPNVRVTFEIPDQPSWSPENADGKYGGMMTLKYGLAESVNCISAYLMKQFGPHAMIDIMRKMGITSPIDAVPALCLGTPDVSVLEMVGAYSTFANKGVWTEPIYITRIEDKKGNVLQEFVPKKVEAISEETAYLMLNLLQGVVQYGTGVRLRYKYKLEGELAGKTGTTQNQSDGWFMGITPDLVSGCWVGCEDRVVHFRTIDLGQGASTALPIYALFLKKVYADTSLGILPGTFERPKQPLSVELNCDKYKQPGSEKNTLDNF